MKLFLATVLLLALVQHAVSDCYLQYPPGSNDRNRERSDNRDNGNLLFDSQNNAQGGYPWRGSASVRAAPDPLTYYSGSVLQLSWTAQHSCGPNTNTYCNINLQYLHDDGQFTDATNAPGLRDGYPDSTALVESDNDNPGYKRAQFSATTCSGPNNDCTQQNQQGTQRIPQNGFLDSATSRKSFYYQGTNGGIQYAMHEGPDYYDECTQTIRNKGLYAADQNIGPNSATGTRQNPNGGRRGLECPEERDYYPYWRYSPFNDIAVLVPELTYADYYRENSQNTKTLMYCDCGQAARDGSRTLPKCPTLNQNNNLIPIDEQTCGKVGGVWKADPRTPKGLDKPVVAYHAFSRDNHLGNTLAVDEQGQLKIDASGQPETAGYAWTIPENLEGKNVILRIIYNISTYDYSPIAHAVKGAKFVDAARNCPGGARGADTGANGNGVDDGTGAAGSTQCYNDPNINVNNIPLFNRPYVDVFGIGKNMRLSIALNTHQSARTFQDRSYVFKVAPRPSSISGGASILNLNVRGRRGNIVQAYPAVEYDFHPSRPYVRQGDLLHIQIHGSDFNAAKNANNGEGWQFSDRSNIVQTDHSGINFPTTLARMTLFGTVAVAQKWALGGQDKAVCKEFVAGQTNEQNSINNCGKLNSMVNTFPADPAEGLMKVSLPEGTYTFVSTRNNNFSNRSQKGVLTVGPGDDEALTTAASVGIAFSALAAIGVAFAGVLFYGKKHPNSSAGQFYEKVTSCGSKKTTAPPDMEYQRH